MVGKMDIKDASYYSKIADEAYRNKIIQWKNKIIKNIDDRAKQGFTFVSEDCEMWPSDILDTFVNELKQKSFKVETRLDPYGILKIYIEW